MNSISSSYTKGAPAGTRQETKVLFERPEERKTAPPTVTYHREWATIVSAAAVTGVTTWPLERTKNNRQLGCQEGFTQTVRQHGVSVAFKGVAPYTTYKIFGIGIQRGVQAPLVDFFRQKNMPDMPNYILAGAVSGGVGGAVVTIPEQIKLALFNRDLASLSAFPMLVREIGMGPLFSGLRITMLRNGVFDSINASLYYPLLPYVDKENPLMMMFLNQFCGVTSAVLDYPLDVLKTRIQTTAISRARAGLKPLSIYEASAQLMKEAGFLGFYAGLRHKLFLYFAVWGTYGGTKAGLDRMR